MSRARIEHFSSRRCAFGVVQLSYEERPSQFRNQKLRTSWAHPNSTTPSFSRRCPLPVVLTTSL